jgi:hypothetical protein
MIEKSQLGILKTQRCSWLAALMIREMTRSRLLARDVASVMMLCSVSNSACIF